jgi:uncharacterized protein
VNVWLTPEALGGLTLPGIGQQARQQLLRSPAQIDPHSREPLSPPDLLADLRRGLNGGVNTRLVDHHVHVVLIPQRGEDATGDPERWATMVVELDCLWQRERDPTGLLGRQHHAILAVRGSRAPGRQGYPRAVRFGELTAPEQRVLGCLIEKRWTTPDQYPLSLNALRLACNQSTSRDPVTDYDEPTVREAAQRLCRYGLARLASGHGSRATKYRHLAEEALGLGREELAVLAVLLLRGPQTSGELKARIERMASLASLGEVDRVLGALAQAGYVQRLERRPGHKEDRFEQLLGSARDAQPERDATMHAERALTGTGTGSSEDEDLADRVRAIEAELASLRAELASLRDQVGSASPTR